MRIKKSYSRKPSYYSTYSSKIIPFSVFCRYNSFSAVGAAGAAGAVGAAESSSLVASDDSVIINIVHDDGGAKAPCLICEGMAEGP
jgi:hypothetical protein